MGAPIELIKRLIGVGVSDEDLQAINDAWQRPVPTVDTVNKASARTARWREKKRQQTVDGDVDGDGVVILKKDKEERKTTAPRGTRLPDGWTPSAETLDWAGREHGLVSGTVLNEVSQFADYWQSVPGARGVKLDWDKTFKNRIRDIHARGKINGHKSNLQLTEAERYERAVEAFRSGKTL